MKVILKDANIGAKVRITDIAGGTVAGCSSYLFNSGSTRLLGLMPDQKGTGPRKIRVAFDGAAAVYDVRRHRYVGSGTEFETEIEPAVPRLFAMVASEVSGLELTSPPSAARGAEVRLSFTVTGVPDLRSVAVVTVAGPDGQPVPHYSANTDIIDGKGSFAFTLALNDTRGVWNVTVRETISGVMGRKEIKLD